MGFWYLLEATLLALVLMTFIAGIAAVIWLIKLFPVEFFAALVVLTFALMAFDWAKGGE